MPQHGQIAVWVTADGRALPEYDTRVSVGPKGEHVVVCWIPSKISQTFQVRYQSAPGAFGTMQLSLNPRVDGKSCMGIITDPWTTSSSFTGLRNSPTTILPFRFSGVETSDDDNLLHKANNPEQGDIVLDISHVVVVGPAPFVPDEVPSNEKFHERNKKALDHSIGYGAPIHEPPRPTSTCHLIARIATFVFKYRPIEMLQANGIAPSPPPLPRPEPVHAQRSSGYNNRRIASTSTSNATPSPAPAQNKRKRNSEPELVELTDDSDEDSDQARKIKRLKEEIAELEREKKLEKLKKRLAEAEQRLKPTQKPKAKTKDDVKKEPVIDEEIIYLTD